MSMIRVFLFAVVVIVAACGATNPNPSVAKGENCSKWEGQSCTHNSECCTLWCVNGECARREP
jgi:hypothetical protein